MTVQLTAIKLVEEGVYLVSNNSYYRLEVDGIPTEKRTIVVQDLSSICYVKTIQRKIVAYKEAETENVKSPEAYLLEKGELAGKGRVASDGENFLFGNIDDELRYIRYVKTWMPVYSELSYEKLPVQVAVTEVRTESGDPDIKSLWNAPSVGSKFCLYGLNRNVYAVKSFREACEASSLKFSIASHSGIRFAQVEGRYVFDNGMNFGEQAFVGTLEQCKQEKERILKRVNEAISLFLAKRNNIKVSNIVGVIDKLEVIRKCVLTVSPMKASAQRHLESVNLVSKLILELRAQIPL
ncbi:hypothetical protein UFOVP431_55 [uncultured Caudovirales phage]|uniref:Uncharacterized protein n=1 Tax=uncultured Caudovirales phage TaxID=2100421 RepID=A0A6J5MM69_9CAUD|nr:hypothetical protein UFOVP431_55 [uncultured Caudovirales phage]